MRILVCMIALTALAGGALSADGGSAGQDAAKFRAWLDSRIEQAAVLVSALSEGKSTLMLKNRVTANPTAGDAVRSMQWGETPFVQVFPVSSPFDATLPGLEKGRVLGAITALESGGWPTDAYLLYYGEAVLDLGSARMHVGKRVQMVWIRVDKDGKVNYTSRVCEEPVSDTGSMLSGPDAPGVTVSLESSSVNVHMFWGKESFAFSFQPEITYL